MKEVREKEEEKGSARDSENGRGRLAVREGEGRRQREGKHKVQYGKGLA